MKKEDRLAPVAPNAVARLASWRGRGWRRVSCSVLLGAILTTPSVSAQIEIDPFTTTQGPLSLQDPPDSPGDRVSSVSGPGALAGAFRGLELTWLEGGSGPLSAEVTGGALVFDVSADSTAELLVTWDGDTDPDTLTTGPGFAGGPAIDLTGSSASAFRVTVDSASAGSELVVVVYSSASDVSRAARLLPLIAAPTEVLIPYSELLADPAGSGADLTAVTALQLLLRASDGSVSLDAFETVQPALAATKVDALTNDLDADSTADPGDTLTYTITITNTGGEALQVDLDDMVDANTTLVGGSVSSTPIAKGDQYVGVGNVTLAVDGTPPGLLANDADPDGDSFTIAAFDATSARGGTVAMVDVNTGTFEYTPPSGFRGVV